MLFFVGFSCQSQEKRYEYSKPEDFKKLLEAIREKTISPDEARSSFQNIMREAKQRYTPAPYDSLNMNLVFPLRGSDYRSVGGKGKGFYARHFDLFNHDIAKSHPAHDIFIYDPDKDEIDNRRNEYIDILSVTDGVVIATETDWTEEKGFKGGNYVWIYDLSSGGLWYYAHQRLVFVEEGQLVKQGNIIGEVGRTGLNAASGRSDTHLHLMYLYIDDDFNPRPINHYEWLKKAKTIHKAELPPEPRKKLQAEVIKSQKQPYLPVTIRAEIRK